MHGILARGGDNMSLYTLRKASRIYTLPTGITRALDDVDFTMEKGEMVVILGPSGSGKSTLLNVLSGIDVLSEGELWYESRNMTALTPEERTEFRRKELGFIFQTYNLIANLTVRENIELGKQLAQNPLPLEPLLETLGLVEQAEKFPYQLSGGQQQRVAIARALIKNPNVLFCDEPTGALDETTGKRILAAIQEIHQSYGTTVVIITHNPSIAQMADTVVRLNSGHIVDWYQNTTRLDAMEIGWA